MHLHIATLRLSMFVMLAVCATHAATAFTSNGMPYLATSHGTYKLGKRPYPPGTRARFIAEGRALGALPADFVVRHTLRGAADNGSGLPPIGDQGAEGSCTAWAGAYAVKTYYMKKANPSLNLALPQNQASPRFAYNLYNGGADDGGYGHEPFEVFMRYGCASMSAMPYVEGQYSTLPTWAKFMDGLYRRTTNYVWLWDWKPSAAQITQANAWLDNGGVAAVGVYATPSFDAWNAGDPPWVGSACTIDDIDHMVCVCGYGPGYYKIANAWGPSFGSNGFIYVSSNYFVNYFSDFMFPLEGSYTAVTAYAKLRVNHTRRSDLRSARVSVHGTPAWNFPPTPADYPGGSSYPADTRDNLEIATDLTFANWAVPSSVVTGYVADLVSPYVGTLTWFSVVYHGDEFTASTTPTIVPDNSSAGASARVVVIIPEASCAWALLLGWHARRRRCCKVGGASMPRCSRMPRLL